MSDSSSEVELDVIQNSNHSYICILIRKYGRNKNILQHAKSNKSGTKLKGITIILAGLYANVGSEHDREITDKYELDHANSLKKMCSLMHRE